MPRSRWETLLRRIYLGQKYSHVHTLSISTDKNQSMKVRGASYIPTYEYNYKVITDVTQYYKNITSPDRHKCENTKRYTSMNSIKDVHELQKKNSRDNHRSLKG